MERGQNNPSSSLFRGWGLGGRRKRRRRASKENFDFALLLSFVGEAEKGRRRRRGRMFKSVPSPSSSSSIFLVVSSVFYGPVILRPQPKHMHASISDAKEGGKKFLLKVEKEKCIFFSPSICKNGREFRNHLESSEGMAQLWRRNKGENASRFPSRGTERMLNYHYCDRENILWSVFMNTRSSVGFSFSISCRLLCCA